MRNNYFNANSYFGNLAGQPTPIDFGIGYRWRPNESNLLVAVKNPDAQNVATPEVTGSTPRESVQRTQENPPQFFRGRPARTESYWYYRAPPPFPFLPPHMHGPS